MFHTLGGAKVKLTLRPRIGMADNLVYVDFLPTTGIVALKETEQRTHTGCSIAKETD